MEPTITELVERLRDYPQLEGVPDEQLTWMATRGRWRRFEESTLLIPKGTPVDELIFILEGQLESYMQRGGVRSKIIEWHKGEFSGAAPYSRYVVSPGEAVVGEASEIVTIDRKHFPEMIRDCYDLTAIVVHGVFDRARQFNAAALHDEKMVSLGKLAAGLAHELNNPASAIARSASDLAERLVEVDETVRAFATAGLTEAQIGTIKAVLDSCLITQVTSIRSPIEQADREDEVADWLEDHSVDPQLAEPLAETLITFEGLERLAGTLEREVLEMALHWVANSCNTRGLALEIVEAATRIHGLVGAVKGFTQMDRARTWQQMDVAQGLSNTLAMLESKARERRASVELALEPELPPVMGFGGELNQVWMNLIDNALDALADGGRVEVTAALEGDRVVVRVVDSGEGIPEEALSHIFDPFFTTKPVGQGTGLGLDIVRRLVRGHDGEIMVESRPGRTEFRVAIPMVVGAAAVGSE